MRAVDRALKQADPQGELRFAAKPWLAHSLPALLRGGCHPPVVVIVGRVFGPGFVPPEAPLRVRLGQLVDERSA